MTKLRGILLQFAFAFLFAGFSNGQIITTIAGNGLSGYAGDGGPATDSRLNHPGGIALDSAGTALNSNIYITDVYNHCIRKITSYGVISTIAGVGIPGYSGDGGPAVVAQLATPRSVALDRKGNTYIADDGNARLRKIDKYGIITTVAGTGVLGYGGDGGEATLAQLYNISDVVVDTVGNVYFTDPFQNCVRKISTARIITTIAGGGAVGFSGDGGPASLAKLYSPSSVAVDFAGNVYIADVLNYRVRKINTSGIINTIAGIGALGFSGDGGPATDAQIGNITGLTADEWGNVYICESEIGRIRKVSVSGIITTIAGDGTSCGFGGDGGAATSSELCTPFKITIDVDGSLYFSDRGNERIRKIAAVTAVNDLDKNIQQVTVAPNPVQAGVICLQVNTLNTEDITIRIADIKGFAVAEFKTHTNKPVSVPQQLSAGIYIISVVSGSDVWTGKVVVE